jgi:thiamine pyrophosphate-dependent acetolactate synthase large subunit-like protein
MMMGLGSLATVAVHGARNLSIVVIDNEHYAETGMQPAHAGRGVNIERVAAAVGFSQSCVVREAAQLEPAIDTILRGDGPVLAVVKVTIDPAPTALPPRDGPYLRSRFREALLGAEAHR